MYKISWVYIYLYMYIYIYIYSQWNYRDIVKQSAKLTSTALHSWWSLVVQVMFHTLMTSSMTSAGHKVGQILKLLYLHQYFSWSVDQQLKIWKMLMAILLVYSTPVSLQLKKFVAISKWQPFWEFWNIKYSFILTSDMKRSHQIMHNLFFRVMTLSMTSQSDPKIAFYIHV